MTRTRDDKHRSICGRELDVPGVRESEDCGGDCLACMADSGDPACRVAMGKGEPEDFAPCDAVLYVPHHAHGDEKHAHCERGIVSSVSSTYVFVRYELRDGTLRHNGHATLPGNLRKRN